MGMKKRRREFPASIVLLVAMLSLAFSARGGTEPPREILGVSLTMSKGEAHERLKRIGELEREERKQQEIWKVADASYSHVIIAFNKVGQMRFITAVAREDAAAKRVRYVEIGDLKKARQAGDLAIKNFNYQWDLPADEKSPATQVIVRGRDPEALSTYSLKRVSKGD